MTAMPSNMEESQDTGQTTRSPEQNKALLKELNRLNAQVTAIKKRERKQAALRQAIPPKAINLF